MEVVATYDKNLLQSNGGSLCNPCIAITSEDQMMMMYSDQGSCTHWVQYIHDDCSLDGSFFEKIRFPGLENDKRKLWYSDCRFFHHKGQLRLTGCINLSGHGRTLGGTRMFICDMNDNHIIENMCSLPPTVHYKIHEKTCMFFEHNDSLFFTHSICEGQHMVFRVDEQNRGIELAYITQYKDYPGWENAIPCSSYVRYDGLLWACSRSIVRNDTGFYAIDQNPPFSVKRVPAKLLGDIYPSGLVKRGGRFLLFASVSHEKMRAIQFTNEEMYDLTSPVPPPSAPIFEEEL